MALRFGLQRELPAMALLEPEWVLVPRLGLGLGLGL